jgi:DNA-binding NarL/FixJ family response regulator
MRPIRVLLAEDHSLVRAGIRALLEKMEGVVVVGEAGDGRLALDMVVAERPDVVLMDIAMAGLNGLEAARRIAHDSPTTRVVILSMHDRKEYVEQALRVGAAGYLLKDAATVELHLALQAVARGETYLSPAVSKYVVAGYVENLSDAADPVEALTPRQREILQLIAEGHSTREIAQILTLSIKTVETHRAQLMERLGIHDVPGLVRCAIRAGLVDV